MRCLPFLSAILVTGFLAAGMTAASADPLLDGSGFGTPTASVTYDPDAPEGDFDSTITTTNAQPYTISMKSDSTYAYVLVQEAGTGAPAPGTFANLYFGVGSSYDAHSKVGFEVTNGDVFTPGDNNNTLDAGVGAAYAVLGSTPGSIAIEFAVPWAFFETDPLSFGFPKLDAADPYIMLRLSQSFGYSVAGSDLGVLEDPNFAVPEPATIALLGFGVLGLGVARRRTAKTHA